MPTGLVLGKFMPPTKGHMYMLDMAYDMCGDGLTIVMCHNVTKSEPSPRNRLDALQKRYGKCVKYLVHSLPEAPEKGWPLWKDLEFKTDWWDALQRNSGRMKFDYVFASEKYGEWLARCFIAEFIPVDINRQVVPISASIIRQNIFEHWDMLMPEYREEILPRVVVAGMESCGKTTLCKQLAAHFKTVWVPEYARELLEAREDKHCYDVDYDLFLDGRTASENALAKQANKVLICDTDAVATLIWCKLLGNTPSKELVQRGTTRNPKHTLVLMLKDDIPFDKDDIRYGDNKRIGTYEDFYDPYKSLGYPIVEISGDRNERFTRSVVAIQQHLEQQAALYR